MIIAAQSSSAAGLKPRTTGLFVTALRSDGKPLKQMKRQSSTNVWVIAQRLAGLVSSQIALDRMKLGRYSFLINPGVFS
jgi:hypothetical protein